MWNVLHINVCGTFHIFKAELAVQVSYMITYLKQLHNLREFKWEKLLQ